jgi:UDP-N-acetylglucosamine 2-epimerase (non-hydrolysing)
MVLTDSGGVQEEAPSLHKPVLVLRESTERIEGVEAGTLKLVGTDPDRIFAEGIRLIEDPFAYAEMAEATNPYGDGQAARRIVGALEHVLLGGEAPAQFGPGYSRAAIARAAGFEFDIASVHPSAVVPSTVLGAGAAARPGLGALRGAA